MRGEEKRVSELEQQAHTTSNAADIAQVTCCDPPARVTMSTIFVTASS